MKRLSWQVIPILIFLGLCIFLWRGLSLDPHRLPSVQIGKAVPAFELPQLLDTNKVFNTKAFQGRVVLLNVWASWCQTCVEEQAFLMQLAHEGVDIYGLNYKDSTDEARHWLETWGNPYRIIGQDLDGRAAIDLGVYGAPETYVLDKQGIIRYRHVGPMKEAIWLSDIKPLMEKLRLYRNSRGSTSRGLSAGSRDPSTRLEPADKLREVRSSLFGHTPGIPVEPKLQGAS